MRGKTADEVDLNRGIHQVMMLVAPFLRDAELITSTRSHGGHGAPNARRRNASIRNDTFSDCGLAAHGGRA